ncbi:hypothetical protein FIBSPDRAFT_479252 [Athelia psychrophila]|uniref:F-box domain-containing protein n=1 Tax=Athelia psychrophila TaxID=1759441 RepID=A0A166VC37_9AGAM|nr:hypothetical protein FIBSPDRAFT_479252 [Fibularhizoctonia sp. CBS 109695]
MKSLSHLELQPSKFPIPLPPQSPLELPNLQFLRVDGSSCPGALKIILHNIRASSLTPLSLSEWSHEQDSRMARSSFPSLRHLIISRPLEKVHLLAQTFPDIEHLTYGTGTSTQRMIVHVLLAAINNCATLAWPKLESIAVPSMYSHVVVDLDLRNAILNLQQAGRPLRLLMLSHHYFSGTSMEDLAQLREVVEIEPFSEDGPRPFAIVF